MRSNTFENLQVYVAMSRDRDRKILAVRVDDILKKDPDFDPDELLIIRKQRDDLWSQVVRDANGNEVEGVAPGFIAIGEAILLVRGKETASAGRHEVTVRALADLYHDREFYVDEYAAIVRDLIEIPEVAESVREDEEQARQEKEEYARKVAEAKRRVDGVAVDKDAIGEIDLDS